MRSAHAWFFILAGICVVAPYVLGVPPRTRRQWLYVTVALAFLAWLLLPLAVGLRSS